MISPKLKSFKNNSKPYGTRCRTFQLSTFSHPSSAESALKYNIEVRVFGTQKHLLVHFNCTARYRINNWAW